MKLFEKIKVKEEMELQILGIPILQYGKRNIPEGTEKYIKVFPKKNMKKKLFEEIIHYLKRQNIEFDDIYISRMNIGETVLLAGLINNWYKKNGSKNPILVLTQKYHEDVIKLYCPNVRYIYFPIQKVVLDKLLDEISYEYKNTHIYYFMPIVFGLLAKDGSLFSNFIRETLGIDKYDYNIQSHFSNELSDNLLVRNVDLSRLIIVAPESASCTPIKKIFWNKLITKLQQLGYNVFCNSLKEENRYQNTLHANLSLTELYVLAQKSKAIIGMRSGLLDYLASIKDLNIFALYSNFPYWDICAENVLKSYTLTKLPFEHTQNINEYNIENYSIDELIENIVKNLENTNE